MQYKMARSRGERAPRKHAMRFSLNSKLINVCAHDACRGVCHGGHAGAACAPYDAWVASVLCNDDGGDEGEAAGLLVPEAAGLPPLHRAAGPPQRGVGVAVRVPLLREYRH